MIEPNHLDRWRGALWGMFVGAALAMPVHWYDDVVALQRDFGVVRDFQAPGDHRGVQIITTNPKSVLSSRGFGHGR